MSFFAIPQHISCPIHWPSNKSLQRRFWSHIPGFKFGLHQLLPVTLSQLLNLPCWTKFVHQGPNTVTNAVSGYWVSSDFAKSLAPHVTSTLSPYFHSVHTMIFWQKIREYWPCVQKTEQWRTERNKMVTGGSSERLSRGWEDLHVIEGRRKEQMQVWELEREGIL